MSTRPNVLLIMSDQHRPDILGCAGASVWTPNIDSLAAEGVRFARTYCQGPLCMPARASFISERYVRDHGISNNATSPSTTWPTFVKSIRDAGYRTACIGKMHLYIHGGARDTRSHASTLAALGFDESVEVVGKVASLGVESEYTDYLKDLGLYAAYRDWIASRTPGGGMARVAGREIRRRPMYETESFPLPSEAYMDNWIGRRAVQWITEADPTQPFFLWVGFAGPHNPWDAPAEYVDRYRNADVGESAGRRPDIPADGPFREFLQRRFQHSESDGLNPEIVRDIRRFYFANVTVLDNCIGEMLRALESKGALKNTWVVYTSDHGEMLGDHGLLTKMVFYEPSISVPLIVRPPLGVDGRTESRIVEQLDLAATLRDIVGAEALQGSEGQSLLGCIRQEGPTEERDVAHSENLGFGAVIQDRYKIVFHEESREPAQFFDIVEDPHEDHNLVDEERFQAVIRDFLDAYVVPFLDSKAAMA